MSDLRQSVMASADRFLAAFEERRDELDGTPPSLTAVDEILAEVAAWRDDLSADQATRLVQMAGGYVLEVGRRAFGGDYLWHEGRDQPVLVVGEPTFHVALMTWDRVRSRIDGDESDVVSFAFEGWADRVKSARPGDHALYV